MSWGWKCRPQVPSGRSRTADSKCGANGPSCATNASRSGALPSGRFRTNASGLLPSRPSSAHPSALISAVTRSGWRAANWYALIAPSEWPRRARPVQTQVIHKGFQVGEVALPAVVGRPVGLAVATLIGGDDPPLRGETGGEPGVRQALGHVPVQGKQRAAGAAEVHVGKGAAVDGERGALGDVGVHGFTVEQIYTCVQDACLTRSCESRVPRTRRDLPRSTRQLPR